MSKKTRKSAKPEKVSAMILKVAEGYIDMGEAIEEKAKLFSLCLFSVEYRLLAAYEKRNCDQTISRDQQGR